MRYRCQTPTDSAYPHYGARGITVHPRWESFAAFLADMGPRPAGTTIDRIDVDGNYEPGNCRWATSKVQGRNKRHTVFLTIDGERKCLAEWAEQCGLSHSTLYSRLKAGWPAALALNAPLRQGRKLAI